jgi:hypothetical protein
MILEIRSTSRSSELSFESGTHCGSICRIGGEFVLVVRHRMRTYSIGSHRAEEYPLGEGYTEAWSRSLVVLCVVYVLCLQLRGFGAHGGTSSTSNVSSFLLRKVPC